MPDPDRSKSPRVHWLRGEPRQCGDRAHRLIAPSLAPTGERRPSMACLRPIPVLPRLSPPGCPWLRRYRLRHDESNVPPKRGAPSREGRRCVGVLPERYMDVPRPRVGAGRGTTRRAAPPRSGGPTRRRGFRSCLAAPAPARSEAFALAAAAPDRNRCFSRNPERKQPPRPGGSALAFCDQSRSRTPSSPSARCIISRAGSLSFSWSSA